MLALEGCRDVRIGSNLERGISGGQVTAARRLRARLFSASWHRMPASCFVPAFPPSSEQATNCPCPALLAQAKRVNIGIALVSNPRVLFLGEGPSQGGHGCRARSMAAGQDWCPARAMLVLAFRRPTTLGPSRPALPLLQTSPPVAWTRTRPTK